jgi:uncharacterized protein YecE (DUF72 family)
MMPHIFIGTSGWNYDHWKGTFYPVNRPKSKWLAYYTGIFSTVEVNATFYRHMKPSTFEKWRDSTPEGFVWAVKANRYITHIKRLQEVSDSLDMFFQSVSLLEEKLGVVLFQLPPSLAFDSCVFDAFCAQLPKKYRYSLEARHSSWTSDEALASLEKTGIAWCISDTAGRYPYLEAVTSDFIYIRLHGSKELYASDYTQHELESWVEKIQAWNRDAYIYFDNDYMGHAPKNALMLKEMFTNADGKDR